jgi:hypothetical protein
MEEIREALAVCFPFGVGMVVTALLLLAVLAFWSGVPGLKTELAEFLTRGVVFGFLLMFAGILFLPRAV